MSEAGSPLLLEVADLDDLVALEMRAQERPWTRAGLRDELTHRDARVFGIRSGGSLVGHLVHRQIGDEGWVLQLGVDPQHRRKGHGRILVEWAISETWKRQLTGLLLEVRADNAGAQALYESLGFIEIGRRAGYYPASQTQKKAQDALVMWLAPT
jgi:ribosomal-protein-alanine N-acetyltransferase